MIQARYTVKEGDTLWGIAEEFLGAGSEWPRLYAYNNRLDVQRVTGRAIDDPDLIFPDQTLLLPIVPNAPQVTPKPTAVPQQRPGKLKDQIPELLVPFVVKYKLDDIPLIQSVGPGFKATIKLSGSVAIQLGNMVPLTYVTNRGMEAAYKHETDFLLSKLVSEAELSWDPASNKISYECMMVTKSSSPVPSSAIGLAISSDKPVPVIRAEIRYPQLEGRIDGHSFVAVDVKIVIEIEPEPPKPKFQPQPIPVPVVNPETVKKVTMWTFAGGVALLAGTIIADFLTAGGSIADDPITIPLALSMMGVAVIGQDVGGQRPLDIQ